MSVVVHYVRMSSDQVEQLAHDPESDWILNEGAGRPDYPGVEVLYLDKAYRLIAWLLSPLVRANEEHMFLLSSDEPTGAARARVVAMQEMPVDPADVALCGDKPFVDERFDIGLGPPAIIPPETVRTLSAALEKLSRADLERHFDLAELDRLGLCYIDETSIMDEYALPEFERVQAFYRAAAAADQAVMVQFT